jgi:hypothetical protein
MFGVAVRGDLSSTGTSNQIFFWGAGNTTTSAIGFKANGGNFPNPTGNGDGYNTYLTMDSSGRGWVFGERTTGFANVYTSGWILNNGIWQANASMRSPIFYDSNDTGYYLDPNTTSDSALRIRGGALHGPNPTWGTYLLVGGDGRNNYINNTTVASVCSTNGNLHMDAASGLDMYLNYYDGNSIQFGNGANGIHSTLSSAGNLALGGTVTATNLIGQGQTWQNVVGSRAAGTLYTNSTSRPITVIICCSYGQSNMTVYVDSVSFLVTGPYSNSVLLSATLIVPPGSTYKADSVSAWMELR